MLEHDPESATCISLPAVHGSFCNVRSGQEWASLRCLFRGKSSTQFCLERVEPMSSKRVQAAESGRLAVPVCSQEFPFESPFAESIAFEPPMRAQPSVETLFSIVDGSSCDNFRRFRKCHARIGLPSRPHVVGGVLKPGEQGPSRALAARNVTAQLELLPLDMALRPLGT